MGGCYGEEGGNGIYVLVCSVVEVVHLHVELDGVVDLVVEILLVLRDELEVVVRCEFCDFGCGGLVFLVVVDEPARYVRVQSGGHCVEEVLGENSASF